MTKEEIRARISALSDQARTLSDQQQASLATCLSFTNSARALRPHEIEALNSANQEHHRILCEHVGVMMELDFWNTLLAGTP
jgi:hypothetical protein